MSNPIELSDGIWVIPGAVNIGVVAGSGGSVILVDTGLNDSSARKALKAVREVLGTEVAAILTTHAHADHFGGNATVVKRTGAAVHAPAVDEAILRYPLLQPSLLFGGADPPASLRGGFLLADSSPVDAVVQPGRSEIAGVSVDAIPLFGHSPGQLGYVVADVFFCADVVLPETVLDRYRIPYLFSLTNHLDALKSARAIPHRVAVPGHGGVLEDGALDGLIDANVSLAMRVADVVIELTAEPCTAEVLLQKLLLQLGAPVADAPSFYLLQPTVFAYLSHLQREGTIGHEVRNGQSLWMRT